jgi:Asp-tRNA(Asn)/Glu-tRNA(Gln) amidotransferase C subunit
MTKNKLSDLNDHLFAQIERLSDEDMTPEKLASEAQRAEAIVGLADQVVRIADTSLRAATLFAKHGKEVLPMLPKIGGPSE